MRILIKHLKSLKNLSKSVIANLLFGFPSRSFINIGVTGTDGKTTTANLIYQILTAAGKPAGLITTLGAKISDKDFDTGFHVTTPTPWPLQKFLRQMKKGEVTHTVLEVTSHGLHQYRVWGIPFAVGVITNITREHLDYHRTIENYIRVKAKLFKGVKFAILNRDDPSFSTLSRITRSLCHPERAKGTPPRWPNGLLGWWRNWRARNSLGLREILRRFAPQDDGKTHVVSYGLKKGDIRSDNISYSASGTSFEIIFPDEKRVAVKTRLLGDYNVSNCLAAAATAWCLKISPEIIKEGLEEFKPLEGRFNIIDKGQKFTAVLDFAHTPAALEKVLKVARQVVEKRKLIVVFGCAGLRDYQKRPIMGKVASELADFAIITAEDPRTESLDKICQEIASGFHKRAKGTPRTVVRLRRNSSDGGGKEKNYLIIKDRREAIKTAFEKAKPGDLVLFTGKGHEKSMCFGKTEYPWSDREVMEELLKNC